MLLRALLPGRGSLSFHVLGVPLIVYLRQPGFLAISVQCLGNGLSGLFPYSPSAKPHDIGEVRRRKFDGTYPPQNPVSTDYAATQYGGEDGSATRHQSSASSSRH